MIVDDLYLEDLTDSTRLVSDIGLELSSLVDVVGFAWHDVLDGSGSDHLVLSGSVDFSS